MSQGICEIDLICKYAPCRIMEICKFSDYTFDNISENGTKEIGSKKIKGKRTNRIEKAKRLSTSNEDIKTARGLLNQWKREDKIGPNQLKALDTIGSTRTENLSDPQREQILSIVQDVIKGEKH